MDLQIALMPELVYQQGIRDSHFDTCVWTFEGIQLNENDFQHEASNMIIVLKNYRHR